MANLIVSSAVDTLMQATNQAGVRAAAGLGTASVLDEADVLLESQRDITNGFVGVGADGTIAGMFETYSDTEANLKLQVIPDKVLVYATDTQSYFVGDGVTLGGVFHWSVPRFYGNGLNGVSTGDPTELTSTTPLALETIAMPLNSSWRVRGYAHFDGDTDSISNFQLRMARDGAGAWASWNDPSQFSGGLRSTFWGNYAWLHTAFIGTTQGASSPGIVKSSSNIASCALTPFSLTETTGLVTFDITYGRNPASNFVFQGALRTAKVGTPTISVSYGFSLERIK